MANRFTDPLPFFDDSTGAPYAGAQLFFYTSGTSTKLNTYSNQSLTIANSNPVVLDSAGRVPNAVFLQNKSYKVVLAPSTDTDPPTSPIWTQDPVNTSDYSATAQFLSGSGSPNGSVAGTAGSATIPASAYWDYANNILYVCTTTGTSSTAVWTAVNATTAAAVVPIPQGYLTLSSGTAIITGDVTAATAVYYTPYTGLLVPIYNGTSFVPISIVSELQLTLSSSHVASNIYDFYIFSLNGVATLGTGPTWSAGTAGSITAGSCARGTGTGGSALTLLQGLWTNAVSMTMRYGNGTTTTTVAANQGTYVGSMFMDGSNGQVSCYRSWAASAKWGIWNAYNRNALYLKGGDAASSWTEGSTGPRPINNNSANKVTTFSGLPVEPIFITYEQRSGVVDTGDISYGIGFNSTSAFSGVRGGLALTGAAAESVMTAAYQAVPQLGVTNITALVAVAAGSGFSAKGGETSCLLTAQWRG
jgi:hypothetical protein